jgi:hypothetical protein
MPPGHTCYRRPGYQRLFDDSSLFFDRAFLPLFYLAGNSMVFCSDVSTYPSWTLSDVPTSGSILKYSHFVYTVQT